MLLGSIDWTNVLVALIAGLPAIIAALYARAGHTQGVANSELTQTVAADLATPSGDSIGHVVERAHDLAAVATLAASSNVAKQTGDEPAVTAGAGIDAAVERLNEDPHGPVVVNGGLEGLHAPPSSS